MIYLVHHGDAIPSEIDPRRPLSDRGRAAVLLLADEAARRGAKPEAIWHSGKLRARQTAEAFLRVCHPFASLTAERGLQPTDPPEWMRDRLLGERRELMLVGHLPNLPRLFRLLIREDPDTSPMAFPQHGLIALEGGDDQWREAWRISGASGAPRASEGT
ncbi:MAG: SixA phosphatase family protein [Vicinamibacterales bacterium]